jgi:RsiW-degrading membrane proteinase PrsW (M82 family)
MESTYFAIALLCGLIPALFWVWFWLREDSLKPEPYFLIAISFIAGMAVVPVALNLQMIILDVYPNGDNILLWLSSGLPFLAPTLESFINSNSTAGTDAIIYWVVIEEVLKYAFVLILVFWNREVDEPIDMLIYMIVVALGFSALENALYIYNPLVAGDYLGSTLNGSFRFLGASLLHVLASGTIGVFLALSYYRSKLTQVYFGTVGLFIAIILHALFNFFIMDNSGETILVVFLFVWMGVILLFLLFEKIKLLEQNHNLQKN